MNLDFQSIQIAKSLDSTLEKGLTDTKFYSSLRNFLRRIKSVSRSPKRNISTIQSVLTEKAEDMAFSKNLKKNDVLASFYDNGSMKFEFGSDVPEPVRKAAIDWAKKRGLKPVNASLAKNTTSLYSVDLIGPIETSTRTCVKKYLYTVG